MASRLKIKIGPIEVEYEGEEKFLKEELPALLKAVSELHKVSGLERDDPNSENKTKPPYTGKGSNHFSTSSIASKLNCKRGTDLIEAAAFSLVGIQNKPSFTRDELTTEMRAAKTFFKKSYVSNLSNYLKTLVSSQKLNEVSTDVFSVPHQVLEQMKGRLGI